MKQKKKLLRHISIGQRKQKKRITNENDKKLIEIPSKLNYY